jgi:hypothetical protein
LCVEALRRFERLTALRLVRVRQQVLFRPLNASLQAEVFQVWPGQEAVLLQPALRLAAPLQQELVLALFRRALQVQL